MKTEFPVTPAPTTGAVVRLDVQDINAEDGSLFAMDSVELVVK